MTSKFADIKSTAEYDRRAAIIEGLRAGRSRQEIIQFFNYPKSTVYDVAKAFNDAEETEDGSGSASRKRHASGAQKLRDSTFLERLQALIDEDPGCSMRNMADKLDVSECTIRRAVKEDLRCKSYVLRVRQMLSAEMKNKRVARCAILLSSLKHEAAGHLKFFSDEKMFCVDAKVNRRNDRWIAMDPEDVPIIGRTKFPASVHVLCVVSSDGDIMAPHFFQKGQTVNKEVYLNVMITVVRPWMAQIAGGRPYVYQQDSAPAHASNLVQNWMEENLPLFWSKAFWPPNSPDLNPLDYYVWGVMERMSNKASHNSTDSLKVAITQAAASMDRTDLAHACSRFRSRIEAVIEADGGWIE
jgi:inhibitor of nuclear factor kappa-B kinase subunit alpha